MQCHITKHHLGQTEIRISANCRQHPTIVNAISCNITDNIAVTMKCVRNKFCASTSQLVHGWQHITQQWKQITMCVMWKIACPPQPFTPDYAVPYRGIGQVPTNSAIETTAVKAFISDSFVMGSLPPKSTRHC